MEDEIVSRWDNDKGNDHANGIGNDNDMTDMTVTNNMTSYTLFYACNCATIPLCHWKKDVPKLAACICLSFSPQFFPPYGKDRAIRRKKPESARKIVINEHSGTFWNIKHWGVSTIVAALAHKKCSFSPGEATENHSSGRPMIDDGRDDEKPVGVSCNCFWNGWQRDGARLTEPVEKNCHWVRWF